MSPAEFRTAIAALGMSQMGAGRFLAHTASDKGARYATGHTPVPKPVAMLLRLMLQLDLKPEHVERLGTINAKPTIRSP